MRDDEYISEVSKELQKLQLVSFNCTATYEILLKELTRKINDLINHDFRLLVQLLYQLDVHENKLLHLIQQSNLDTPTIIAKAIIERQLQKIESRRAFKKNDNDIPENERW